jgi:hypothetical protein
VWSDIPEGKHDRGRFALKHHVEKMGTFGHAPGNIAHADASIACGIHLARKPSFIAVTSANDAKPTRSTYGSGEFSVRDDVHGRK